MLLIISLIDLRARRFVCMHVPPLTSTAEGLRGLGSNVNMKLSYRSMQDRGIGAKVLHQPARATHCSVLSSDAPGSCIRGWASEYCVVYS